MKKEKRAHHTDKPSPRLGGVLLLSGVALAAAPGHVLAQDAIDVLELVGAWGPCPRSCPWDHNGDGRVDGTDLAGLLAVGRGDGIPEGYMIIEGDIIVPEDFYDGGVSAGTYASNLWAGGIVPYEFNENVEQQQRNTAETAMAAWEAVANVEFQWCPSDSCDASISHLHIQDATVNSSFVGDDDDQFEQIVNIASWNGLDNLFGTPDDPFIVAHELGHALGFWHEQSRANRGDFVEINADRICPGSEQNFAIRGDQGPFGSGEYPPEGYDFDSLMHYGVCAFSTCCNPCTTACLGCFWSCRTIDVRVGITIPYPHLVDCSTPAECTVKLGQRNHLSYFDALTMSFLYPETDWRFVDLTYTGTQSGTFLQPYQQFTTGEADTPPGGTLWVQPGAYAAVGIYSTAMTIRAPIGDVVLGDYPGAD